MEENPKAMKIYMIFESFEEFANAFFEYIPPFETEVSRIIREKDLEGLEKLLDSGYDLESKDEDDCTLIELISDWGLPKVVQLLFDRGAKLGNSFLLAKKI